LNFQQLSPAKIAGKKQNQKNKQNESKPTSSYHWASEVKATTAKQEQQYD